MSTQTTPTLEFLREEAPKRVPPMEGKLTVKGLDGPIKIIRDRHGVPHVKVTSTHDVWFSQGFVHAQERLWGMERVRRFFHGTLAEIVGEGGLGPDRLYRRVGVMRAARLEWPHVEKEGREVVEAYTAGVNAFLDIGFPLPIEFEILGYEPAKWEPTDVTGRWKLIAYSQSMNGQVKLGRYQVLKALGPKLFSKLFPYYPEDAPTMVPSGEPAGKRPMDELLKLYEGAHAQSGMSELNGSNSWVADGTLTDSGYPLLAGDPHLAIGVPSFWHVNHIEGPEFSFIGASMPGVPGVTYYGHNGKVAWGMSTAGADAQDLFLEEIRDGDAPQYLHQGEWRDATVHVEEIRVKGRSEPVVEKVLETHHGPIVSGGPASQEPAVALKWMGNEARQTFSTFVAMHSATTVHELMEAHREWTTHTNKVMADATGNIGYMLTGQLPIRRGGPAHVPVPGWTGAHEWEGEVPFDEMPRVVNPPNHFSNNSNNLIVSYDFPHYIAPAGSPSRGQRVAHMLKEWKPLDIGKFSQMQADRYNIPGHRMAKRVASIEPSTEAGRQAREILAAWDGNHDADAQGGAVYETLVWKLYDATLGRLREGMVDPKPSEATLRTFMTAVLGMIQTDDRELLAHESLPFDTWDVPLAEALDAAGLHLKEKFGEDTSRWTWGGLHAINFRHGIGREDPAASLLNAGTFPAGGSGDTVNAGGHPGGASFNNTSIVTYRQIIDLSDFNKSLFIVPPGQSGHVGSPHYNDLLEDYLAVRYRPLTWDWSSIEAEAEQTLEP